MSRQAIKEKTDSSSNAPQGDLQADFLLNKHVFRTCAYSAAGFGLGLAASLLFFKHKATMSMFFAGTGAGYGIAGFTNDWANYKRYKSWAHTQSQRAQRSDDTRQGLRDFDGFVFNQYAQSQRGQERQRGDRGSEKQSQQRDDSRQDRSSQQRDDQKQDRSSQNKSSTSDQQRHESSHSEKQDKDTQKKSEGQAQQGKQGSQSQQNQQNKSRQQGKEQPLNPEAKEKQDVANQVKQENQGKPGQGSGQAQHTTQDKRKKEEELTYGQSIQGSQPGVDEHQRGEKGPQNTQIPPSQKDYTGGHANQGVNQQQVHRGSPDADKSGKSPSPSGGSQNKQNEKDNKGQQGKQENQALQNVDLKGQSLQTFQSNPLPLGKAGPTHEIKKDYQEGRNRADDPDLDNTRRRQHGLEQDRLGQSVKEGNNIKVRESSDTRMGVGNYQPGVAEQNLKNQVNAVLD